MITENSYYESYAASVLFLRTQCNYHNSISACNTNFISDALTLGVFVIYYNFTTSAPQNSSRICLHRASFEIWVNSGSKDGKIIYAISTRLQFIHASTTRSKKLAGKWAIASLTLARHQTNNNYHTREVITT